MQRESSKACLADSVVVSLREERGAWRRKQEAGEGIIESGKCTCIPNKASQRETQNCPVQQTILATNYLHRAYIENKNKNKEKDNNKGAMPPKRN